MRLRIEHLTQYRYSEPLRHAIQTLCLTPAASAHQTIEAWSVSAADGSRLHAGLDAHGNLAHVHTPARRCLQCTLRAEGVVVTHGQALLHDACTMPSPWSYLRPTPMACAHAPLHAFATQHLGTPKAAADAGPEALLALAAAVQDRVRYTPGATGAQTPAHRAFDQGQGVCQDQAHVFIAACRSLGLPARYVSGYFHAPDAAALASHAWAEVCVAVDERAWLAIDVTHACLVDERHVRLATGPDYAACAPVRGVRVGGGDETLSVQVRVSRA